MSLVLFACRVASNPTSVALMGPSGAGKSSFLDILASHDKSGVVNGSVEYTWGNHRTNARPDDPLSGLKHSTIPGVGYVYQDDQLLPTETVRETLFVSAQMRLPQHYSMEEIHERVDFILAAMELTAIQRTQPLLFLCRLSPASPRSHLVLYFLSLPCLVHPQCESSPPRFCHRYRLSWDRGLVLCFLVCLHLSLCLCGFCGFPVVSVVLFLSPCVFMFGFVPALRFSSWISGQRWRAFWR